MSLFIPIAGGGPARRTETRRDLGPIGPDDLTRLAKIGFGAVESGDGATAKPIFELLMAAQPKNAAGAIGLALAEYAEGSADAAIRRLREAIRVCSTSVVEAKATLAMLLTAEGRRAEAETLRRDVARAPDGAARRMITGPQSGPRGR